VCCPPARAFLGTFVGVMTLACRDQDPARWFSGRHAP
jgi:hypothetical protein